MIWMLVRELFKKSSDYVDLQALIMLLVFEKKVLSMDDDAKELNLYFLPKHKERMNKELRKYKKKLNMKYKPYVFEVKHGDRTTYIYANDEGQARYLAHRNLIKVDEIRTCDLDELVHTNGMNTTFRVLTKNKKPQILGGN